MFWSFSRRSLFEKKTYIKLFQTFIWKLNSINSENDSHLITFVENIINMF